MSADLPSMILAYHCHFFSKCLPSIMNSSVICVSKQGMRIHHSHQIRSFIKLLFVKTSKNWVHIDWFWSQKSLYSFAWSSQGCNILGQVLIYFYIRPMFFSRSHAKFTFLEVQYPEHSIVIKNIWTLNKNSSILVPYFRLLSGLTEVS